MFLYKSATNKEKTTNPILVAKHGSHNQASHGRKRGGGGASGGSSSASSPSSKPKKPSGSNKQKFRDSLSAAKDAGLDKEEAKEISAAFSNKDQDTLLDLEAGFAEAAIGRHGGNADSIGASPESLAHDAITYALRDLDPNGEYLTLPEQEMAMGKVSKHGSHNQASHTTI